MRFGHRMSPEKLPLGDVKCPLFFYLRLKHQKRNQCDSVIEKQQMTPLATPR
jgi:hypothetical protein